MSTGLRSINDQYKKEITASNWVRRLRLADGEKAWFSYMATGEESDHRLQSFHIHNLKEAEKFITEYCTFDDEGECVHCLDKKASTQFGVWVWVYYVLRKKQNPGLGKNDKAKPWKKIRYREELYYKQDINDVILWQSGPGMKKYIFNQLIEAFEQYGTLMDRQYVMSRTGAGFNDTNYSIKPIPEQSALDEKQLDAYRILPPVREVVSGRQTWPPRESNKVLAEEGEDIEDLDAPEPTIITAEADEIVSLEDDDEEAEEELESVVVDKPSLISATLDDALDHMEGEESETASRLRPMAAKAKVAK